MIEIVVWANMNINFTSFASVILLVECLSWNAPLQLTCQWASCQICKVAGCACAGNAGNVFPPLTSKETASYQSRHAPRHLRHTRAMIHVGIDNPRWRGKRLWHSRRMRNPQFFVPGKRPMLMGGLQKLLNHSQKAGDLRRHDVHVTLLWCLFEGLYSLSGKTSYRKISWSLEAARFRFKLFQLLWNLASTSAALPRCLSNFRAIRPLQHPISRHRDFRRFGGKTSYRLVNRGPVF